MQKAIFVLGAVAIVLLLSSGGGLRSIIAVGNCEFGADGEICLTSYSAQSQSFLGVTKGFTYPLVSIEEARYSINGIDTRPFYQEQVWGSEGGEDTGTGAYSKTASGNSFTFTWLHDYGQANRQIGDFQAEGPKTLSLKTASTSFPSGENAFFKGLSVRYVPRPPTWDLSVPVPKDSRLWVSAKDCPAPAGKQMSDLVLTFQVFDGSTPVSFSSFKHPVVRFCASNSVQVKLPSGATETVASPYADLVFTGSYAVPPGETQVWVYLTDASEFPQACPSGQAISQVFSGSAVDYECKNVAVALSCAGTLVNGECLSVSQTTPFCPAGLYNEKTKRCEAQTDFCPEGYSTIAPSGGSNATFYCSKFEYSTGNAVAVDVREVDGNGVCASKFAGSTYFDGRCISPASTVETPREIQAQTPLGNDLGLVAIVLVLLLGGGYYFLKKD